ncbi:SIR2 family NAD-dependent protein deacylase [Natrialbaceae archaeon AArc-T1-2]|uniref:SIR2 family NAD-dependent protein deacylase n=1 Tax=Natrialbaceae archaeon AArc-T1-2 TaxID=3053904 RepID=UPI00255A7B76|nr:Sir2 family NAD-dependent protein deacetylase [Natrialbaceae archaeon AArc-T1-2]WIV66055.1 Sir2 family NAD-dependent protein deacetylase [Natrialbaceae archaeon AArc-T1-2]
MDDLERLAEEIGNADTVVALTGAGISAPSGVPTFRGDDGVWKRFEEGQFTYGRFQRDPAGFWTDRLELYETMFDGDVAPNAAHEALADLGESGHLEAVATQNTDGLHAEAARAVTDDDPDPGTVPETGAELLELHGNAHRVRCVDCGRQRPNDPILERIRDGDLPPRCECGGVYKPDVVLFGEQLSAATLQRSQSLARESDVFLAIGSSLVVEPAASLPRQAGRSGGTVGIVNLEETPHDGTAAVVLREDVTDVLPRLRDAVDRRC